MIRTALSLAALIVAVTFSQALAEPVPLTTAHGKVEETSKDTLVFQPRDESGKFGKSVSLQVTGTTKVWLQMNYEAFCDRRWDRKNRRWAVPSECRIEDATAK